MAWLRDRFRFAFAGLRYGIARDRSIRFQGVIALAVIVLGFILQISLQEWLWILLSITLVITAEIFNSCIEKTIDYISLEKNRQAGLIKDMSAGAVLAASLFSLITGCIVFIPALIRLL